MKGHRLHVRRKMKENEENRGLVHKRASMDKLVTFCQLKFGALSLLSLSLSLSHSLLDT